MSVETHGAAAPSGRLRDLVMRLPLAGSHAWLGLYNLQALAHQVAAASLGALSLSAAMELLSKASLTVLLLTVAAAALIRHRRVAASSGLYPRLVALLGTCLPILIVLLPRQALSPGLSLASSLLMLLGALLGTVVVLQLGRSLSVLPEARRLVVDGAYRVVRHPLYLVEQLSVVGVLLLFVPPWNIVFFFAQLAVQLERIRLEERVLAGAFPDYAAYAARTPRLIPGLF